MFCKRDIDSNVRNAKVDTPVTKKFANVSNEIIERMQSFMCKEKLYT